MSYPQNPNFPPNPNYPPQGGYDPRYHYGAPPSWAPHAGQVPHYNPGPEHYGYYPMSPSPYPPNMPPVPPRPPMHYQPNSGGMGQITQGPPPPPAIGPYDPMRRTSPAGMGYPPPPHQYHPQPYNAPQQSYGVYNQPGYYGQPQQERGEWKTSLEPLSNRKQGFTNNGPSDEEKAAEVEMRIIGTLISNKTSPEHAQDLMLAQLTLELGLFRSALTMVRRGQPKTQDIVNAESWERYIQSMTDSQNLEVSVFIEFFYGDTSKEYRKVRQWLLVEAHKFL